MPPASSTRALLSAKSRTLTGVSNCQHPKPPDPDPETNPLPKVNTYLTYPKDNKTPEKAILFLTDIFGIFPNAQLLADDFANSGYLTVMPDLFQGDQISVADMESGKADLGAWLPKHQTSVVDPVIEKTIKYVRETLGVKKIGAVGYCFGGKVCLVSGE